LIIEQKPLNLIFKLPHSQIVSFLNYKYESLNPLHRQQLPQPDAHGFFQSFDPNITVCSAGTEASGKLNPKAVAVIKKLN
jgi:protein-tyrosine-phosphatase